MDNILVLIKNVSISFCVYCEKVPSRGSFAASIRGPYYDHIVQIIEARIEIAHQISVDLHYQTIVTTGADQVLAFIQTIARIKTVFAAIITCLLHYSLPEGELTLLLLLSADSIAS